MLWKGREWGMLIGGRWTQASSGRVFPVVNPATGEELAHVPDGTASEATEAIESAHKAFPGWSTLPARERAEILDRTFRLILDEREELARLLTQEQGKPISEARAEVAYAAEFVRWYAEEARRVYGQTIPSTSPTKRIVVLRQPLGVVAAITPWTDPAAMVTRKVAAALAAGCSVILKPAEQTPLTALALAHLFELGGLPPGTLNVVTTRNPQTVGEQFLLDLRVRGITFTGSTEVGKMLLGRSSDQVKRVSLELGGHAPLIIFEDADLASVVHSAVARKMRNMGQTCATPNRLFVHEKLYEPFLEAFARAMSGLRMGNGLEEGVQVGPLIDENTLQKAFEHIEDACSRGAKLVCGGRRPKDGGFARGYFLEPTVLADVPETSRVMHEETFGPVAPVLPFRTEAEAIARANATRYGLAAYVFTRDLSRAIRVCEALEFGVVGLNDPFPAVPHAPFGGWKESGIGREGGLFGLEEFLEIKYISIGL